MCRVRDYRTFSALAALGHRVTVFLPRYGSIAYPPGQLVGITPVPVDGVPVARRLDYGWTSTFTTSRAGAVVTFRRDGNTGRLTAAGPVAATPSPVAIVFSHPM